MKTKLEERIFYNWIIKVQFFILDCKYFVLNLTINIYFISFQFNMYNYKIKFFLDKLKKVQTNIFNNYKSNYAKLK